MVETAHVSTYRRFMQHTYRVRIYTQSGALMLPYIRPPLKKGMFNTQRDMRVCLLRNSPHTHTCLRRACASFEAENKAVGSNRDGDEAHADRQRRRV